MEKLIKLKNEAELDRLAMDLWRDYSPVKTGKCLVIALSGPLGAGKTRFVKGLAKAMEIKDTILSPTFTIHSEYTGADSTLDHIDAWRLEEESEIDALGIEQMIGKKGVVAIEWAEKFRDKLIKLRNDKVNQVKIIWLDMEYGEKDDERRVKYEDFGD